MTKRLSDGTKSEEAPSPHLEHARSLIDAIHSKDEKAVAAILESLSSQESNESKE